MSELYTIGYEGASAEQLIETLCNLQIKVLVDVRELPLSRKKGLSKTSLGQALNDRGIQYLHLKKLGDPKQGRDAAKAGDYVTFEKVFLQHLNTADAQNSLSELLKIAGSQKTCILCFERCAHVCHRSYIADEAVLSGFEVFNLVADRPQQYLKDGINIPSYNSRKSLSAAE
ncbi:DUF488 domain-containing protein [Roseovarius sp. A21]|uniref:DUF488 domain-containing protein n=1 Tax=Roseovarius bejariae TaxID=2576383 RepID=A0A844CJ72_9RHOB|nr:DUF488 domain-containing protein [Roseovarius bejariae]MRU14747.1 DUF488 domain-containing protein [Roseovarius bejariae]